MEEVQTLQWLKEDRIKQTMIHKTLHRKERLSSMNPMPEIGMKSGAPEM